MKKSATLNEMLKGCGIIKKNVLTRIGQNTMHAFYETRQFQNKRFTNGVEIVNNANYSKIG